LRRTELDLNSCQSIKILHSLNLSFVLFSFVMKVVWIVFSFLHHSFCLFLPQLMFVEQLENEWWSTSSKHSKISKLFFKISAWNFNTLCKSFIGCHHFR
jgi:hypothetical protein